LTCKGSLPSEAEWRDSENRERRRAQHGRACGGRRLSRHFEKVTIVDKDLPSERAEARAGVGQGHHVHVLLKSGEQSIERLLPGTTEKLLAHGAVPIRMSIDTCICDHGQWLPRRDLGYRNLSASRPLIEQLVVEQLMLRPGVEFRHGATVESLSFGPGGSVDGVRIGSDGRMETIHADLAFDCTGRLSHTGEELAAAGYSAADEAKFGNRAKASLHAGAAHAAPRGPGTARRLYRRRTIDRPQLGPHARGPQDAHHGGCREALSVSEAPDYMPAGIATGSR
jgi:hypothetical protein